MAKYTLPPNINDWITKLNDTTVPLHVRENLRMMLENVRDACSQELDRYKLVQNKPVGKQKKKG